MSSNKISLKLRENWLNKFSVILNQHYKIYIYKDKSDKWVNSILKINFSWILMMKLGFNKCIDAQSGSKKELDKFFFCENSLNLKNDEQWGIYVRKWVFLKVFNT